MGGGIPDALQVRFRLETSIKVSLCIDWMDDGTAIKQKLHGVNEINVERLPLHSFYCRFLLNWFSLHELHVPYNTSFTTQERSMANFGRNEGDIDESTTDVPYLR